MTTTGGAGPARSPIEEQILRAVRSVRYGSVEIVTHDSRVVQIEWREKIRPGPRRSGRRPRGREGPVLARADRLLIEEGTT